jgi:hypothetical protein
MDLTFFVIFNSGNSIVLAINHFQIKRHIIDGYATLEDRPRQDGALAANGEAVVDGKIKPGGWILKYINNE